MFGWFSDASTARSRAKRCARPRSIHSACGSFSATCRSNAPSARSASQTAPMPPSPSGLRRRYGPMRWPGCSSAGSGGGLATKSAVSVRSVAASSFASSGDKVGIGRLATASARPPRSPSSSVSAASSSRFSRCQSCARSSAIAGIAASIDCNSRYWNGRTAEERADIRWGRSQLRLRPGAGSDHLSHPAFAISSAKRFAIHLWPGVVG